MHFQQHQEFLNAVRQLADEAANDPRNEDDFDTWTVGMEPIPWDKTWASKQIQIKQMEFKPIPSCPGYEVSFCGQVKGPKKLLKLYKNKNGYLMFKPGRNKPSYYVHKAVAETWLSGKQSNYVNHIDHNKTNNVATNLEWSNPKHNHDACVDFLGKHPSQKLTQTDIKTIFFLHEKGYTQRYIAKQIGCTQTHICRILKQNMQELLEKAL